MLQRTPDKTQAQGLASWTDRWTDRWTNGWMDVRISEWMNDSLFGRNQAMKCTQALNAHARMVGSREEGSIDHDAAKSNEHRNI